MGVRVQKFGRWCMMRECELFFDGGTWVGLRGLGWWWWDSMHGLGHMLRWFGWGGTAQVGKDRQQSSEGGKGAWGDIERVEVGGWG